MGAAVDVGLGLAVVGVDSIVVVVVLGNVEDVVELVLDVVVYLSLIHI